MPENIKLILGALFMVAVYGSGLLFWPIHRVCRRERAQRGRVLFWLFVAQLTLYFGWGLWMLAIALQGGVWIEGLILILPLNLLFVLFGCAAFLSGGSGDSTEVNHVS
jgi:hypothetical protein